MVREFLRGNNKKNQLPEEIKPTVLKFAVLFEARCREGSKPIIHLEAFSARTMALIK